jgi:hypothetical protein
MRWGIGALISSMVVPFPFPTRAFFAIAGVLDFLSVRVAVSLSVYNILGNIPGGCSRLPLL